MKRPLVLALTGLVLALVLAGCGGSGGNASLGGDDVAVVGGQTITKQDFQNLLARAQKTFEQQKRPFPKAGTPPYETLKGQAIAFLVQRAEFAQKAEDMGVKVSDKQIDDRIAKLKKQYYGGSDKRYEDTLKQQGLTDDQARDEIKALLISEGLSKKITGDVKATDQQVQAYYASHKTQYQQPESRDVRHILVPKKALAARIYAEVKADPSRFPALAKKYSKDPGSAAKGGQLTVSKGQTVPEFDKAAFSLKKGQISPPVKTQYGYHVIQALSAIRSAQSTPLDKVKAPIRQQLEQQQKNDVMTKWVDQTKRFFCGDDHIKYQIGYKPAPDPCVGITSGTGATSTTK